MLSCLMCGSDSSLTYSLDLIVNHSDINYEVVVVDDNSPDKTYEVAEELASLFGDDRVVRRPEIVQCIGWNECDFPLRIGLVEESWKTWTRICLS